MKITNEELVELLNDISEAINSILHSHQQMAEASLSNHGIDRNQKIIQKKRQEIEALRSKVMKMKQSANRQKQLEKVRNKNQKPTKPNQPSATHQRRSAL